MITGECCSCDWRYSAIRWTRTFLFRTNGDAGTTGRRRRNAHLFQHAKLVENATQRRRRARLANESSRQFNVLRVLLSTHLTETNWNRCRVERVVSVAVSAAKRRPTSFWRVKRQWRRITCAPLCVCCTLATKTCKSPANVILLL